MPQPDQTNTNLPAHFSGPFRLLDLPPVLLSKVLMLATPTYGNMFHCANTALSNNAAPERRNLAPRPPPTAISLTCKALHARGREAWLRSDIFHFYVSSWTSLDANAAILTQLHGMSDVALTLDIRAGREAYILDGLETPLRASRLCAQVRAIVEQMNGVVRRFSLRIVVGKYADKYVTKVVLDAFKGLKVDGWVRMIMGLDVEECLCCSKGNVVPAILKKGALREFVGVMVGKKATETMAVGVNRSGKGKPLSRCHITAWAEAEDGMVVPVSDIHDAWTKKFEFEAEGKEVVLRRDDRKQPHLKVWSRSQNGGSLIKLWQLRGPANICRKSGSTALPSEVGEEVEEIKLLMVDMKKAGLASKADMSAYDQVVAEWETKVRPLGTKDRTLDQKVRT